MAKGDFTRFTHKPKKHYTGVLKQQGRVDLDADWNEQVEILDHLNRTQLADMIGPSGVSKTGGGFKIGVTNDGADLTISPGHIYVDGIRCAVEEPGGSYTNQPNYPAPPALNPAPGRTDLVYLDVWQRHITAIEDPEIREKALGGPDTTTRLQTVCQVKVLTGVGNTHCDADIPGRYPPTSSCGRLSTKVVPLPGVEDPCLITPESGYQGLENRLYRVEIHRAGNIGANVAEPNAATFKWSRDNGAVVYAIEEFITGAPTQVKVTRLGRDEVLTLHEGDWVEVLGDETELKGESGLLTRIDSIDEARRIITLDDDVSSYGSEAHPKLRRWDQDSAAIPVTDGPIELEQGIQIEFSGSDQLTLTAALALPVEGVVSGDLSTFPTLTSATPAVDVTIGTDGPHTATFAAVPANLNDARTQLETAIRAANPASAAFSNARVAAYSVGGDVRLIVVAGASGNAVSFTAAPADSTTVTELTLDSGSILPVEGIVSGDLSTFSTLTSATPAVDVTIGTDGPHTATFAAVPANLNDARTQLETAIRAANPASAAFSNARVAAYSVGGDVRLIVVAGASGNAVSFTAVSADSTTVTELGLDSGSRAFKVGDYWVFYARTATGEVEPLKQAPPRGIEHHYSRLALVTWASDVADIEISDCRHEFPALTELTNLLYIGGDGQEIMPDLTQPRTPLEYPLQVRVANGECPVENAQVRFRIVDGPGGILDGGPGSTPNTVVDVPTGPDGIASCAWQLEVDVANSRQQVGAALLGANGNLITDADGNLLQVIYFNAHLSISGEVAYESGACLGEAATVKDALDQLCQNITLYYIGGNGQEGMPGEPLPERLQVKVANGGWPIAGQTVRFTPEGAGSVAGTAADLPAVTPGDPFEVVTGPDGIASCAWQLAINPANPSQLLRATLLDENGVPVPAHVISFNANLSIASQVSYTPPDDCEELQGAATVQEALDLLCQLERGRSCAITVGQGGQFESLDQAFEALIAAGAQHICICLLPGDHRWTRNISNVRTVEITGCGIGSRILLRRTLRVTKLEAFALQDVVVEVERNFVVEIDPNNGIATAILFESCIHITIRDCNLSSSRELNRPDWSLLTFTGMDPEQFNRIHLANNLIRHPFNIESPFNIEAVGLAISVLSPVTDVILESNRIVGAVSFYPGKPINDLDQATAREIATLLLQSPNTLIATQNALHIRNNHITRVAVTDYLVNLPANRRVFQHAFVTDNHFEGSQNTFLAQHVALTTSTFTADLPVVGISAGETATYIGNRGPNRGTQLWDLTIQAEEVATLLLTIVNL